MKEARLHHVREAVRLQDVQRRTGGASHFRTEAMLQRVSSKAQHPELVGERAKWGREGSARCPEAGEGVTHPMKVPGIANHRAGMEELQTQRGIV